MKLKENIESWKNSFSNAGWASNERTSLAKRMGRCKIVSTPSRVEKGNRILHFMMALRMPTEIFTWDMP